LSRQRGKVKLCHLDLFFDGLLPRLVNVFVDFQAFDRFPE
jgi:hypothetical protein